MITTTDRYDNDDRLLSEKSVDASTAANDTFTTYAYGGTSNPGTQLTNETVYGGTDTTGAIQSVTQYQYNLQGQMSQASVNTSTSSGNSHSTSTYGYDPDGNRVSQSVVSDNGVPTAPVTTSTTYLVDENNPTGYAQTIEEFTNNSTAPSRTYVIGMDVIAQRDSHGLLTFLYDGHGSTRALVNTTGQVQQRFAYDAYGNQLTASNLTSAANAFTSLLYSGQQTDPSTGLQYLRARYYSSTMGRFTTFDSYAGSSQDPLSLHKYLYADANPTNESDPSGHFSSAFGNLAHDLIGARYLMSYPGAIINSTVGIIGSLKPDIFDPFRMTYGEIKPLSFPGITQGYIQMAAYDAAYGIDGSLGVDFRHTSWPDGIQSIYVTGVPVIFFNVNGLIFYTDEVEEAEELEDVKDESSAFRVLRNIKGTAEEAVDAVKQIVRRALGGDEIGIEDELAIDTLDSLEGGI